MKQYFNRRIFFIIMKTILFVLPIFLITNKLYIKEFGDYNINWDMEFILNFFAHDIEKWLFVTLFFIGLFMVSYSCEKWILPMMILLLMGNTQIPQKSKIKAEHLLKRKLNFPHPETFMLNSIKPQIFSYLMFIPVTLILWLIYINSYWYLSIPSVIIFFIIIFYSINSVFNEYNKN